MRQWRSRHVAPNSNRREPARTDRVSQDVIVLVVAVRWLAVASALATWQFAGPNRELANRELHISVDTALDTFDALVVGAGPSGLSVSRELGRAGIRHTVLERGDTVGHTWAHQYDGLVLHTGKHFS